MVSLASGAQATTITFDDLPGNFSAIANGYGGLDWNNFDNLNGDTYGGNPSGYQNGVVSHSIVAYNGFGDPASFSAASPFTLNDFYITAAWNDGLDVTVTGLLGGVQQDQTNLVINTSGPTHVVLNWAGIDEVDFSTCCGVNHGYDGGGTHFALDNVTFNGVPEPAAWGLMILGFAGVGVGLRSARRAVVA
jgi:hypothetical protein